MDSKFASHQDDSRAVDEQFPETGLTTQSIVSSFAPTQELNDGWQLGWPENQAFGSSLPDSQMAAREHQHSSCFYSVNTSEGNDHIVECWLKPRAFSDTTRKINIFWNHEIVASIDPVISITPFRVCLPDTDQARTDLVLQDESGETPVQSLLERVVLWKTTPNNAAALKRSIVQDVVLALNFQEGQGVRACDSSKGHHDAILSGQVNWLQRENGGGVLELPGQDGKAEVFQLDIGGKLTIAAWVKLEKSTDRWSHIIDFGNGPMDNNITLAYRASTNAITFQVLTDDDVAHLEVQGVLEAGRWVHIIATADESGRMALYKNGELVKETLNGAVPARVVRKRNLVGGSTWGDGYLNGALGELIVLDRALDDETARVLYNVSSVDELMKNAPFDVNRSLHQLTSSMTRFNGDSLRSF